MNQSINEKLFLAVKTDNVTEVEKVLTAEKINAASYFGAKSIVLAAAQENLEILKMLLENGAKFNRESFWKRPASMALSDTLKHGNIEILKLLLQYGAGVEKRMCAKLLEIAVLSRHLELLKLLLIGGAKINNRSTGLAPLLKYAKENGDTEMIEILETAKKERKEAKTNFKPEK